MLHLSFVAVNPAFQMFGYQMFIYLIGVILSYTSDVGLLVLEGIIHPVVSAGWGSNKYVLIFGTCALYEYKVRHEFPS